MSSIKIPMNEEIILVVAIAYDIKQYYKLELKHVNEII